MPKIFISHSSKDNVFAKQLADALTARGAEVWIDLSDISAGKNWSDEIQAGLDACDLMILVITPDSMASKHVNREWQYYDDDNKPIIPVIWIPVGKLNFQLRRVQHVEFHGQTFDSAFIKLTAELARWGLGLAQTQTPPPAPPRIQGGETTDASKSDTPRFSFPHPPEWIPRASEEKASNKVRKFPIIIKPDWVGEIIPEPFEWCVVPAGKVTLEPGGYLKEATTFDVPEFQIARYPITNAQFEVFVTAKDGWIDSGWWDFSKDAKLWRREVTSPQKPRFDDCADCPRETISWYEAVAFTRWLSTKTGSSISLPSEQQWQRAAQGDDRREYPWGQWDSERCNTRTSQNAKTMPVTHYINGVSPFGVMDMSGSVWEWCKTNWLTGSEDLQGFNERVLRGGSWYRSLRRARVDSRYLSNPEITDDDLGFRISLITAS